MTLCIPEFFTERGLGSRVLSEGLRSLPKGNAVSAEVWWKQQRHVAMWKRRGREVSLPWLGCVDQRRRSRKLKSVESVCTIRQGGVGKGTGMKATESLDAT